LLNEGIAESAIAVTGNTVIDALIDVSSRPFEIAGSPLEAIPFDSKRIVLVTAHRRESFGEPFEQMLLAMRDIVDMHGDVEIVYPVHPNPNVREAAARILSGTERIHLLEPLRYEQLLFLMDHSTLLLTDSGGIQEEGPSLRKPVLVMREVTERAEGIEADVARLVGTDRKRIVDTVHTLLTDSKEYDAMASGINPYGDGKASKRIADILLESLHA